MRGAQAVSDLAGQGYVWDAPRLMSGNGGTVKQRIEGWLLEEGLRLVDVSSKETAWVVAAAQQDFPPLTVFQPREHQKIVVRLQFTPGENILKFWRSLNGAERSAALLRIRLRTDMLSAGVRLTENLSEIGALDEIYLDGLTQDRFWRSVRNVRKAAIHISLSLKQLLEDPIGSTAS